MSNLIVVKGVSKYFSLGEGYKIKVLSNISFSVKEGESVTILAQKSAGKSTLLKILADILSPSEGSISLDSNYVYLPSLPSSFPWLTPLENIKFAAPDLAEKEAKEVLARVGLEGYENHCPINKSYGMKLRISIARAIAKNPKLIIMDEPFNYLANDIKLEIFNLLKFIKGQSNLTYVFGSSNVNEALYLSDRILLMKSNPAEIIEEIDCSDIIINEDSFLYDSKVNELRLNIERSLLKNVKEKFLNISL